MAIKKKDNISTNEEFESATVHYPSEVSTATYTVDEFVAASAALCKSTPDVVRAAFKLYGVESATKEDGIKLIEKYLAEKL